MVPSSVATLLVENINSTSLLQIQENNSISGSAFKKGMMHQGLKVKKRTNFSSFKSVK